MNERDDGRQTSEGERLVHHERTNSNIARNRLPEVHQSSEYGYSRVNRNTSSYSDGMHRSERRDCVRHNYQEGHISICRGNRILTSRSIIGVKRSKGGVGDNEMTGLITKAITVD